MNLVIEKYSKAARNAQRLAIKMLLIIDIWQKKRYICRYVPRSQVIRVYARNVKKCLVFLFRIGYSSYIAIASATFILYTLVIYEL